MCAAAYAAQQQHPLQRCLTVVDIVLQHPDAFPFAEPGCENYYEIISKPMDLGTIRKRLMASMGGGWVPGQYGSPEEVWNDLQLIWSNCRTFNGADSQVSTMAGACERTAFDEWIKHGLADVQSLPRPVSGLQRRGSSRCSVCVKAKRGSCGTDNAVRGCIYRPGGPLPALQRGGSKTSMASGQLPPRPKSAPKPPLAKAASSKPPASKRKRVRVQRMTASTAAAAAALYQWHGRDPAALQAIIDTPPPAVPPLVAAGPPKPLPEPDASTLAEEQRVLKHYEEVMAQRKAFPKVEAEMHEKLRVLADAQRRLDDIIAQQAARAADRMQHHVDAPAQQAPLGDAEQQTPLVCMRAEVLSLGAFLFGPLAGASGAMSAPS